MRVALLTQNARSGDAIGRHIVEKVAYFLDRGARVHVVVSDLCGLHPSLKSLTVPANESIGGASWSVLKSADLIVVDFPQYYPQLDWLPLLADGKRRIVFDYHGVTPAIGSLANHRDASWRSTDAIGLAGFADVVLTHSRFAATELQAGIDIEPGRTRRLGYVIDSDHFCADPPREPLRQRLGLNPESKLLLFVGRLAPNKRVPVLIRALRSLPEFHLVVVGPSGDVYESERLLCREVAEDHVVGDRVHFLGTVDESTLLDCYRSATLLVNPSIHEGFCLPVIEAMACGLPVIAARATALPETIADAGLTFAVDDPDDLVRAVRRLVAKPNGDDFSSDSAVAKPPLCRVAVVTPSFGPSSGGAERSLTLIARLLQQRGWQIEVLTTQVVGPQPSFPVHCFSPDPIDPIRRSQAEFELESSDELNEAKYFANTLGSAQLVEFLKKKDFDAVIVGPSGMRLTRDVVRAAGARAIVAPCVHDEPVNRTQTVRAIMDQVGGVLYHSAEEQHLAQTSFGFNHPNATAIGTWIDTFTAANRIRGFQLAGGTRFVLCCGRKVREKGLPNLVDWARKYDCRNPGRSRFVFAGSGNYPIPDESWALDLGNVSENDKCDLMGAADALVQLSDCESLSLVVLESLALSTPVIVNGHNAVLAGHVREGLCGWSVTGFNEFQRALNEIWQQPDEASRRGMLGQQYVTDRFGNADQLIEAVEEVIANLSKPLVDVARQRGFARVRQFSRPTWRAEFDRILEATFDLPPVAVAADVELTATDVELEDALTWPVALSHRGGVPLVPTGPGRTEVITRVRATDGEIVREAWPIQLQELLAQGRQQQIHVTLPSLPLGRYELEIGLRTFRNADAATIHWHGVLATLVVTTEPGMRQSPLRFRKDLQKSLDAARLLQQLPTGYIDVSTGRFARWKRRIKEKLLNNFRTAYVDEIAKQQTRFNRQLLKVLAELTSTPNDQHRRSIDETLDDVEADTGKTTDQREVASPVQVGGAR